jgi:Rrf2 family protein
MDVSAKVDYAIRALLGIASHAPGLTTVEMLVEEQRLPRKFIESILGDLRRAGFVRSQRGVHGGFSLARPADQITLGAVFRAVDGPLAEVRGLRPNETEYIGAAEHLPDVWVAVRASLRRVLDEVTIAQVLSGRLPGHVHRMIQSDDAWAPR